MRPPGFSRCEDTPMKRYSPYAALALCLVALSSGCKHPPENSRSLQTALDRYVAAPDPTYSWRVAKQEERQGAEVAYIDLTSQTWLTPAEVNQTSWRHWLIVYTPAEVAHDTALLFISGGSNHDEEAPEPKGELSRIASACRSVVAELRMIPNQPLIFGNDGVERAEDDLIAYTWDKYLRTGDDRWPARLPMTKAVVRAMDTLTAFSASEKGGHRAVNRFIVAGGSKRGWTTWTTAIVDKRVVAVCPIVIDLLNVVPSFIHHYKAYGFYAPAVGDYVEHGIMDWMATPEFEALMKIVEPYEYRERLTMPKLMLNACGDEFFLPDSSQFYFNDLPGVKYLRYVPNAGHSLKETDALETLTAWHHAILNGAALPRFDWERDENGDIHVHAIDRPKEVRLWQATNPTTRDFRIDVLGPAWTSEVVEPVEPGHYVARAPAPERGWTACMVELTFDLGGPAPMKLTTRVWVTPDTLRHNAPQPKKRSELIGEAR